MIIASSRLGAQLNKLMLVIAVTLAFTLALGTGTARADRIDGDWCSLSGKRLSIDGPNIVTPGGTILIGIYERHKFSYIVPVPEIHAGARIEMSQLNEQTMVLRRFKDAANTVPTETWKRCEATS